MAYTQEVLLHLGKSVALAIRVIRNSLKQIEIKVSEMVDKVSCEEGIQSILNELRKINEQLDFATEEIDTILQRTKPVLPKEEEPNDHKNVRES